MRQIHRWLAVCFAPFLLWIGTTGLLIQLTPLFDSKPAPPPVLVGAAGSGPAFRCPDTMTCRPKQRSRGGWIKALHSGEQFGPAGKALSILSSLALIFFASSGAWMYFEMWRGRARRSLKPRWFW